MMNVQCRSTAPAGQPFQITFSVNARASNFKMPSLKGLTLVSGPSTGFSSSMSIINGQVSQTVTNTFTIVVVADHEGTANVGVASCTVDGKAVNSRPFSVKIDKEAPQNANNQRGGWGQQQGGWGQPRGQQQQQQQQAKEPAKTIDANTLFARASINKSNLYQGEEAIIVYKIYTQVPLTQFQIDKLPRNKGFWSEDLSENMTQVKQYSENYNGRQYQVAEIRRGALYPQESGKLNIAPLKTDVVAIIQTRAQRQRTGTILDFFIDDPFFTPTQQQAVVKSLTSNSINVNVKPLPEAPAGFAGGVGNFSVSAKSDLKELHANEAFTYTVTISGRGNLSLLEAPQIEFPKGMEVYEPRVVDNIHKGDNGLSGSRTFEWIVTPQTQGEYDMPAFDYIYFDPSSGNYVTKQCNKVHIKVSKALHNATAKSDVTELNSDIHHIMKSTSLRTSERNGKVPASFWIVILLALATSTAVVLYARRQQEIAGDEASMRLQRANKLAKKRLRNAEKYLSSGNDEQFYEEIYKALWGGIADKFNIPLSTLSSDTIRQQLADKNVDESLQQQILDTLKDVDFARFAPGDSSTKKQQIYNEAMQTITNIAAIRILKNRSLKNATIISLMMALSFTSFAGNNSHSDLFRQANTAYDSGDYDNAAELYNTIVDGGSVSWELYYNMGNSHYRLENYGLAILNYERALRLAPNKKVIKDNLALARSHTTDNIEELPRMFLVEWTLSVVQTMTLRGWLILVAILFIISCALISIFLIAKDYTTRKRIFVIGAVVLLLTFFSALGATIAAHNATKDNEAVILAPLVVVKGSPDAKSVDKFVLHEGTKLTINDTQDNWWQITIADGKTGWIDGGAERI